MSLSFEDESSPNNPDTPALRANTRTPRPQTNMRNSIFELSRQYTESINEYNSNIAQYNRNIDRLIRLLEEEVGVERTSQFTNETPTLTLTPTPNVVSSGILQTQGNISASSSSSSYSATASLNNIVDSSRGNPFNTRTVTQIFHGNTLPGHNSINNASNPISSIYMNPSPIQTYRSIVNSYLNHRTGNQQRGMTEEQIQNATTRIIYDETNASMPTQCHISLDEFSHGQELLQIRQCGHIFNPPELRRWFTEHFNCPVCRCDVTLNGMYLDNPQTPSLLRRSGVPTNTYETPNVVSSGIPQYTYETPNVVSSGIPQYTDEDEDVIHPPIYNIGNSTLYFREYGLYNNIDEYNDMSD